MSIGDKNVEIDDFVVIDDVDDEQSHSFDVSDEFDHTEIYEHHDTDGEYALDALDALDALEWIRSIICIGVFVPKSYCVGSEEISSAGIKTWTPNVNNSILPAIGMVFDSIDLAYNFYKEYAFNGGFEVRKSSSKRGFDESGNSIVRYKYFLCSKQGSNEEGLHKHEDVSVNDDFFDMDADCFDDVNTLTSVEQTVKQTVKQNVDTEVENKKKKKKRNRPSQRTGCRACICIMLNKDNRFVIQKFVKAHNHILVHPHDIKHLKSQRGLNNSQKSFLFKLNEAGIGPCRGYRSLRKIKGGDEDVGCSKVDCKNWKRDVIKYIGEGDGEMFVQLLENKKKSLTNFSFEYFTVLNNNKWELAGAFWADQASKENYKVFGDVVSFDSTYRTNKYDMKFIPFTGIDNHKRCVTFGAALLAKEDADSYKWLCEAFKKAFPEEPQIVMTDQDPSMIVAIEAVFKRARHRLCMWHITEKITAKIGPAATNLGFKDSISQIVWTDKLDPDDFDNRWFSIVARYNLEHNSWLNDMFNLRRKWIPAYFRYWDMSGLMRTSSRSESENHMFQQLMSNSSTLVEFISFFETAMQMQRQVQSKNDHDSRYKIPKVVTDYEIEEHAVKVYTKKIFEEVQGQIKAAGRYCMNYKFDEQDGFIEYTVADKSVKNNGLANNLDKSGKPRVFDEYIPAMSVVKYSEKSKEVSCDCRLFERIGYFCRHILYVLRMANVKVIPNKYVKKRWCIDAISLKDPNTYYDPNQVGSSGDFGVQMKEIYEMVDHVIALYKDDPEKLRSFNVSIRGMKDKAVEEMGNDNTMSKDEFIEGLVGIPKSDNPSFYAPTNVRSKGCGTRITNVRQEAIKQQQVNHRTCTYCNELGHNSRGCKLRKEKLLEQQIENQKKMEEEMKKNK